MSLVTDAVTLSRLAALDSLRMSIVDSFSLYWKFQRRKYWPLPAEDTVKAFLRRADGVIETFVAKEQGSGGVLVVMVRCMIM